MRFTDRSIKALKPKSSRYEVWDAAGNGFGIRVSPKGVKSFVWLYWHEDTKRRMTLGQYPSLSLADARVRLAEAQKIHSRGKDPAQIQIASKKAEKEAETLAELVDEYLDRHARVKKKSAREDERLLKKDVVPKLGRRKAKNITRRQVISLLDGIVARGAPITANRVLAVLRRVYSWAISRDIVETNPCSGIEPPGEEGSRERSLSDLEIGKFWHGLDEAGCTESTKIALKLMLVTGQRRSEVVGTTKSELDLKRKEWTIPANRTKNGQPHLVPLSDLAVDLFKRATIEAGDLQHVFPSAKASKENDQPMRPMSASRAMQRAIKNMAIDHVSPHDLRRTAATGMAKLGVSRFIIERVLNHADRSVTAKYDLHEYAEEKQDSLTIWAEYLYSIGAGDRR